METITTDLKIIALVNGIGDSVKDALYWLSGQRKEWLLLFNNADDTSLNLHDYFPHCSHGNIIITTRNHNTCLHATHLQSAFQISGMLHDDAKQLLLRVARLNEEPGEENERLVTLVKVIYFWISRMTGC